MGDPRPHQDPLPHVRAQDVRQGGQLTPEAPAGTHLDVALLCGGGRVVGGSGRDWMPREEGPGTGWRGARLRALHPLSILPGGLWSWGSPWEEVSPGWVASCPGGRAGLGCSPSSWVGLKESRMCMGRALRALSNFSMASLSTSGVLTVGPGRGSIPAPQGGLQLCPCSPGHLPFHLGPVLSASSQGSAVGLQGHRGKARPPPLAIWVPSSPWAADTARSLHSPVPTPA